MTANPASATVASDRGTLRELLRVSLPLVISSGSFSLMNVADRVFFTWLSPAALASALPSGLTYWLIISLPMGIAIYTNTFVAQYDGAGRRDRVMASVWQGIYLALFAGVLLLAFVPLAEFIFRLMGHSPEVQRLECEYFSVLVWGATPMLLAAVLSAFFSGRGQTLVVMWVNIVAAVLNLLLNALLIFGLGPLPALGVRGAALGTVIAQSAAAAMFAWIMVHTCHREGCYLFRHRAIDRDLLRRMLWFGLPNGIQFVVDVAGFVVFIAIVGQLGAQELAATTLAFNLNSLAFIPLIGMGTAVMTLVGRRIGEREPHLAVRTAWLAFAVSALYVGAWAILYLGAPHLLLAPYAAYVSADQLSAFNELQPLVVTLLRFVVLYSVFDALSVVFGSAVRGAGDTRFSLWFSFACGWLLMVLPVYLAWEWGRLTLSLCWWAVSIYIIVIGVGFVLRFQQGRWQSMSVMEHSIEEDSPPEVTVVPAAIETAAEVAIGAPLDR